MTAAPLFDYSPKSTPLTVGVAGALIQIKVQNLTAEPAPKDVAFKFSLPTAKFGDAVVASADRRDLWSVNKAGGGTFVASQTKSGPFKVNTAVAFLFDNLRPQGAKGDHLTISVDEIVGSETTGTVTLDVELVEAGASVGAFWAERIQIRPDEGATLSWRTARAQTVSLRWGSTTLDNQPAEVPDETKSIKPMVMPAPAVGAGEVTYTLRASSPTGWSERSLTVSVANVTAKLWADPAWVDPGQKTTLRWKTSNAVAATLDGQPLKPEELDAGQRVVVPGHDAVYALAAFGQGQGNVTTSLAKVTGSHARIVSFAADPVHAAFGKPIRLSWSTIAADQVSINPGVGVVAGSGEVEVNPAQSTTYILRVVGPPYSRLLAAEAQESREAHPAGFSAIWVNHSGVISMVVEWRALPPDVVADIKAGTVVMATNANDPRFNGSWIVRTFDAKEQRFTFEDSPGPSTREGVRIYIRPPEARLSFELIAQGAWTDASKATPVLFSGLRPGQRAWVELTVRNTGVLTWTNTGANPVDLVTSPARRPSLFADPSWPGGQIDTAAHLTEASVPQGRDGTYKFWITIPARVVPGVYDEKFFLVRQWDKYFDSVFNLHAVIS